MNKNSNGLLASESMKKNNSGVLEVALVCVCYNAYQDALRLLKSIEKSYSQTKGVNLTVVLSDNSTNENNKELIDNLNFSFQYIYIKNDNIGYFPAFYKGVQATEQAPEQFDYVIVSNVDLTVAESFFNELYLLKTASDIGVIAPRVLSQSTGLDSNPKILVRPSKFRITLFRFISSSPFSFSLYKKLKHHIRGRYSKPKSVNTSVIMKPSFMYGAHGAFMVFTKQYFNSGAHVNYPRFLFGEEGFVAEECRKVGLKVEHQPVLVINDREHGSTSLETSAFICNEHKKSYDYFLKNYMK